MKKIFCIAVTMLILFSFAACDDGFIVITDGTADFTANMTFATSGEITISQSMDTSSVITEAQTGNTAVITTDATEPVLTVGLSVIKFTSPIKPNNNATLTLRGMPDTEYHISVVYSSGESTAKGLENKISDADGIVSWTWKIGSRVKSGDYKITVNGGGETAFFTLHVE